MCNCFKYDDIVLYPELNINQFSDKTFPLGMILKNENYLFGGGWGGTREADGVRFKNLSESRLIKIKIKHIENIKIIVYIKKYDGRISEYILENVKRKIIIRKLHTNDTVYFGYQYKNLGVPILKFKVNIKSTK